MKIHKIELDVDFIGGQGSLTIEEEKALSAFFKQRKINSPILEGIKGARTTKKIKVKA